MPVSNVTKCICHDRTFEEIKEYADKNAYSTVKELQDDDFCSCSCGLCVPYVEITLKSGQIEFEPGEPFLRRR